MSRMVDKQKEAQSGGRNSFLADPSPCLEFGLNRLECCDLFVRQSSDARVEGRRIVQRKAKLARHTQHLQPDRDEARHDR